MSSAEQKRIERAFLNWVKEVDTRKKVTRFDDFCAGVRWITGMVAKEIKEGETRSRIWGNVLAG